MQELVAEFVEGALIRIHGSEEAHLNGEIARVQNFNPDKGEYKVCILNEDIDPSDALRSLSPSNLEGLTVTEEVFAHLEELSRIEVVPAIATVTALRLRSLPIDLTVLRETQVGKVLNQLTKPGGKLGNDEVFVRIGRGLVKHWREMYHREPGREQLKSVGACGDSSSGLNSKSIDVDAVAATPKAASQIQRQPPSRKATPVQGPLMTVASREAGSCDAFLTVDTARCMARIWNQGVGGQCSRPRSGPLPSQDLCGSHERWLQQKGELPHGRVDGDIPKEKLLEYKDTQLRASVDHLSSSKEAAFSQGGKATTARPRAPEFAVPDMPPIGSQQDAHRLVECMKNAPSDRFRFGLLAALDRTPQHHIQSFFISGGMSILEKWLRERSECRYAILTLLLQIDVGAEDVKLLEPVVRTVAGDAQKNVKAQATQLLDKWRQTSAKHPKAEMETPAESNMPSNVSLVQTHKRTNVQQPAISAKRPKVSSDPVGVSEATLAQCPRDDLLKSQIRAGAKPVPISTAASQVAKESGTALPESCPPELRGLDPRIQAVLAERPKLIHLLQKHPAVLKNFSAGSIARLGSLLKRSQETEQLQMQLGGDSVRIVSNNEAAASRTITLSRLPGHCTQADVEALFDDFGPVQIDVPRESRGKRHVGVAYVTLLDSQTALRAARSINGSEFRVAFDPTANVSRIHATLAVPSCVPPEAPERISWKSSDELWEVRMYHPHATVDEACRSQAMMELQPTTAAARTEFQDAARKEREEQAKLIKTCH